MRWEFGLGDIEVSLFHGHSKKDASKGRVNSCWGGFVQRRNGSCEDGV